MKKETRIQIGLRLFFAALILFVGGKIAPLASMILAGIVMSMPNFKFSSFHKRILGEGFTEDQTKELKELLKGVADKNKELVKEELKMATDGLMKKDDLAASLEKMGLKADEIKKLTDAVEKQGLELNKMLTGGGKGEQKSYEQILEEKATEIKALASGNGVVKFSIPSANKTQVERSAVANNTGAMRLPGLGELPYLGMVMLPLFRQAKLGAGMNGTLRYYDQVAVVRGADFKAEGAAFAESEITWGEYNAVAQKLTDSIPVTEESFNDIDFIKGELDRLMNLNLALKEDAALYSGTGVAPQIKGINVYATAKDAVVAGAPYAGTVGSSNLYDLIAVLRVILSNSKQSKYAMSHALLNPADILKYKLKKGADGHYVLPPFITADGKMIDGCKIVESNQVTANTLTAGDFRYGTVYEAEGLAIEMGRINDQFVKGAMTIRATKRELLLVRNVDLDAFIKIADIDAAVAALED